MMEAGTSRGIKHKSSPPPAEASTSKRFKSEASSIGILNLSDCTLLYILKYLDTTTLYQLGQTCDRFANLILDETFWVHVDARRPPNDFQKYKYVWENVNGKTKHLYTASDKRCKMGFSVEKLICTKSLNNLTVLALEHQTIKYCNLSEFPKTLEEISFKHSYVSEPSMFFRHATDTMVNLKVLLLDCCQWLTGICLMSIGRFPKLEILSLYMCMRLQERDFGTFSVLGICGFKSLKVLDARFTAVGELIINSFYKSNTLQAIYFQSFTTTYCMESYLRKRDVILNKTNADDLATILDKKNEIAFDYTTCQKYANETMEIVSRQQRISDKVAMNFKKLKPIQERKERPKSVLYKYPYNKCTCGFMERNSSTVFTATKKLDNRTHIFKETFVGESKQYLETEREKLKDHFLSKIPFFMEMKKQWERPSRLRYNSCLLPDVCQIQTHPDTHESHWLRLRAPRNDHEIRMLEHATFDTAYDVMLVGERPRMKNNLISLISEVRDHIQSVKDNQGSGGCINKILFAISVCAETCEIIKFAQDSLFVRQLDFLLSELAQNLHQDVDKVLQYHSDCFSELCIYLSKVGHGNVMKRSILRFFRNLLYDETGRDHDPNLISYDSWNSTERKDHDPNQPSTSGCSSAKDNMDDPEHCMPYRSFHHQIVLELSQQSAINSQLSYTQENDALQIHIVLDENPLPEIPTNIREISLRGFDQIGDKTLNSLKALELVLLDVRKTNVTENGIKDFLLCNPQCRLVHDSACVCYPNLHF